MATLLVRTLQTGSWLEQGPSSMRTRKVSWHAWLSASHSLKRLHRSCSTITWSRQAHQSGDAAAPDARGIAFWEAVKGRVDVLLPIYREQGLLEADGKTRGDCWIKWEGKAAVRMVSVTERLARLPGRASRVKVLFAFDEARALVVDADIFLPLRRATSAFTRVARVLLLVADTTANIGNISSPVWMDISDRMPGTNLKLSPPMWAAFSADHGMQEWVVANVVVHLHKKKSGKDLAIENVTDLARDKVLGGYAKLVGGTQIPVTAAMAVLGSRCALYINPHCSSVSTLVAKHLMTVVKVDDARECLWGTWPMEPIVAQAAKDVMDQLHSCGRDRELYFPLLTALREGWMDRGSQGELVVRIIMLRAFDEASAWNEACWCTVDQFVQALVGTSLLELAAEQEGKALKKRREEEMEVAWKPVFLTDELRELAATQLSVLSFHKVHRKSEELTAEMLQEAAVRRCGIVASEGTDHFVCDKRGKVKVHSQAKARESDTGLIGFAKESPPFCGLPYQGPFLTLHMNVVGDESKVSLVDPCRVERSVLEQKSKGKVLEGVVASRHNVGSKRPWEEVRNKNRKLFDAWSGWLDMPRESQIILKANGLGCFKELLGDEAFSILREITIQKPGLDDGSKFQQLQKASVQKMFPFLHVV